MLYRRIVRIFYDMHAIRQIEGKIIAEKLQPMPNDLILDVGCGSGNITFKIAESEANIELIGIDTSLLNIKTCIGWKYSNCDFVVADAHNLPFKANIFTKSYSNCVLEHTTDPYQVIGEMSRVIRSQGDVILTVDSWDSVHFIPLRWIYSRYYGIKHYISKEQILEYCQKAGIEVTEVSYYLVGKLSTVVFMLFGLTHQFHLPGLAKLLQWSDSRQSEKKGLCIALKATKPT